MTERGGGACQMSFRGLSCDSATSGGATPRASPGDAVFGTDASGGQRHGKSPTRPCCPSPTEFRPVRAPVWTEAMLVSVDPAK
jgi:hypothetical protein